MANIIEECNALLSELYKFEKNMIHLGPAITDNRLKEFEIENNLILPDDFKYILKTHNGISLEGTEIFGIDNKLRSSSLDQIYSYEHFEVNHRMPIELLPFSPDGRGNHYCLDLAKLKDGLCPVVFWQHDFNYNSNHEIEECNVNFMDWVKEVMIDWTLEDYNYDGSEK